MLFNSFKFLIYFPLVAVIYFIIPSKLRVLFLLLASYYFYMNWQPVYAVLIFFSTTITWLCGTLIQKEKLKGKKKAYLVISLIINFGILFFFKYFNFVNDTIFSMFETFNLRCWTTPASFPVNFINIVVLVLDLTGLSLVKLTKSKL